MSNKKFSQAEVNRIVAFRINREHDRLTKAFETQMKRCMASIHLMLHQEMCALKRDLAADMMEPLLPGPEPTPRPDQSPPQGPQQNQPKEVNDHGT